MDSLSKKEYNWIVSLQRQQSLLLKDKRDGLVELYHLCKSSSQRQLIQDLLSRFTCFDEETYNWALLDIAKYITTLGYEINKTAIVALCHDSQSDSSQVVLDDLKVPITICMGHQKINFINRFNKIPTYYSAKNGSIRHFIAVDDFTGSGQTVINRYTDFKRMNLPEATIDFCLIAGMKNAINLVKSKGISLFIVYDMDKGITDYYSEPELSLYYDSMYELESRLAERINETSLSDYSFGFGQAESLFIRHNRNIPNNVFPVFWWKKYKEGKNRITLFERVQDGY